MNNTTIFIILAILFAIVVFVIINDNIQRQDKSAYMKKKEDENNHLIMSAYNNSNDLKNYQQQPPQSQELQEFGASPEMELPGYENELMYSADDIKDGSYANQFKEVDYSKMKMSNNQIGFNPQPRCSSGALPFVDVHMNYLLSQSQTPTQK